MQNINLRMIMEAVQGSFICPEGCKHDNQEPHEVYIQDLFIDSRKVESGSLFLAIKGPNMDGHDYASEAEAKGAAALIVSRDMRSNIPQILVQDTSIALSKLAGYYRNRFQIPVIGVTGSTGKTSTKEMISSVLSQKFVLHKTEKNFNNEIGLPLTILKLQGEHEIMVLEMGMSNSGEIERLSKIAKPSIGVITNVGTAHIENLGSRENIFKAKMEITAEFGSESLLIVNADDEYLSRAGSEKYEVKRISIKENGDYNAADIINRGEAGVEFKCVYKKELCTFETSVPGIHNVYNALAAIAIGEHFNLDKTCVFNGIKAYRPIDQRMNIINTAEGIKIINDCYNANPDSMKAALDVLSTYEKHRKVAILGDMFELGDFSEEAHRFIGTYLRDKCDMLIAIGNYAKYIYEEAEGHVQSHYFNTKDEAKNLIGSIAKKGDVILIKASRGMKMEEITNYLIEDGKKGN